MRLASSDPVIGNKYGNDGRIVAKRSALVNHLKIDTFVKTLFAQSGCATMSKTTYRGESILLRWLRSPRPAWRPCPQRQRYWLINVCLLLIVLMGSAPVQADALDARAPQQQSQQSSPVVIVLVPGQTTTANGVASSTQSPQYIFNASAGQNLRLRLTSPGTQLANFQVRGVIDNRLYTSSSRDWSEVLTLTKDYRVTVSAIADTGSTLEITYGAQPSQPARINFLPSQTSAERIGATSPPQNPQYIFAASAGQTLRVSLSSVSGQANFSVRGVIDNQIYKADNDPRRDWSQVLTFTQDYLVTLVSPASTNFTLQIFLTGPTSGDERINFNSGESTAVRTGTLQANVQKSYVVYVTAGNTMWLLLGSTPVGSANFFVVGVVDGIIYKQPSDPAREWSRVLSVSQDYRIILFSPVTANYTLEVTVPTPLPPSPTPVTPVPTVPAGCTFDTIQNGGFEVDGFWLFGDSPVLPAYNSTVTHTPLRSMRLGIDPAMGGGVQNHKAFSSIRQPFQIPMTASISQLRWWNFYRTEEGQTDSPGIADDKQQVVLLNPDLTTVAVLRSVRRNTGIWQEELVDLTPYRGRPLLLYFNVYNDGNGLRTWQYLDDVVIIACYPEMTATPFAPTPVPTQFPTMVMPTIAPSIVPTVIVPSLVATLFPPTIIGDAFLATPSPVNGEPVVIELPPQQQSAQIAAVPAVVLVQPTATSTPQPPVQRAAPRVLDRPLNEVLQWIGIMIGALAVIGIIVALIWQASSRRDGEV